MSFMPSPTDELSLPVAPATAREKFTLAHAGAAIFMRQKQAGIAMLAVKPGRVALTVIGNISSEHIVGVLKDADMPANLGSDAFDALIDLSGYTGVVDWRDIQEIKAVMPTGASEGNKNAYVVRNTLWLMVAKITAAYFAHTECAAFLNEGEARVWLGWN